MDYIYINLDHNKINKNEKLDIRKHSNKKKS